jgi:hypothetical protein
MHYIISTERAVFTVTARKSPDLTKKNHFSERIIKYFYNSVIWNGQTPSKDISHLLFFWNPGHKKKWSKFKASSYPKLPDHSLSAAVNTYSTFLQLSCIPEGYFLHLPHEDKFLDQSNHIKLLQKAAACRHAIVFYPLFVCLFSYYDNLAIVPTFTKFWIYCPSTFISMTEVTNNCV